jgi:protein tyrosine phosphatase (PTP) superfamily phosphohydrolase (DUF442 family)
MKKTSDVTQILNFVRVSDSIGTGGQPTLAQIQPLADEGYRLVINLATADSEDRLPDEGAHVARCGMDYVHLPVVWRNPTPERFHRFSDVMSLYQDAAVFVHCVLNMRASAFVFLCRVIECNVPIAVAEPKMTAVWQPNRAWADFIDAILASAPRQD